MPPASFKFADGNNSFDVAIQAMGNHQYQVSCGGCQMLIKLSGDQAKIDDDYLAADKFMHVVNNIYLSCGGCDYLFTDLSKVSNQPQNKNEDGTILSPMHGILVDVSAHPGLHVDADTKLAVLEAMKMRHEILAGAKGVVRSVLIQPSTQVSANEVLFEIDIEGKDDAPGN